MRFGNTVQITEAQIVDLWSRKYINPSRIVFSLVLRADPDISITVGLSCGFESHYKDEVLFNRR